jgi:hypothetical protein
MLHGAFSLSAPSNSIRVSKTEWQDFINHKRDASVNLTGRLQRLTKDQP